MNFKGYRLQHRIHSAETYTICTALVIGGMSLIGGCGGNGGSGGSVPGSLVGSWGSKAAELDINAKTVTYTNPCGTQTLNGTVKANATRDFVITGPVPSNIPQNGQYTGHVQGNIMHLTIVDPKSSTVLASEDLTFGVTGEVPFLSCP